MKFEFSDTQDYMRISQGQLIWATAIFGIVVFLMMMFRLMFASLSPIAAAAFTGAIIGCFVAAWVARSGIHNHWAGMIIILSLMMCLFVGIYEVGGVTQPIAVVAPSIPMFATLLMSHRWAMASFVVIAFFFIGMSALEVAGWELPQNNLTADEEVWIRSIYIVFTVFVVSIVGWVVRGQGALAVDRFRSVAILDHLTGVPNRRSFDDLLESWFDIAKRQRGSLVVLAIDIDNFKLYNDTRGHAAGDECLTRLVTAMTAALPEEKAVLARIGGDEFAVVLRNIRSLDAVAVAGDLRLAVDNLALTADDPAGTRITATIGIAGGALGEFNTPFEILSLADRALYAAKASGKNCVHLNEA